MHGVGEVVCWGSAQLPGRQLEDLHSGTSLRKPEGSLSCLWASRDLVGLLLDLGLNWHETD